MPNIPTPLRLYTPPVSATSGATITGTPQNAVKPVVQLAPQPFSLAIPTLANGSWTMTFTYPFPQPNNTELTPAPIVGRSGTAAPVVRGYGAMRWTYRVMQPDVWYGILALWQQSRPTGAVCIQWPDPESGTIVYASARFPAPIMQNRTVGVFRGAQLSFTHLGIDDSVASGFWLSPHG